jgi:hypothetical protein
VGKGIWKFTEFDWVIGLFNQGELPATVPGEGERGVTEEIISNIKIPDEKTSMICQFLSNNLINTFAKI